MNLPPNHSLLLLISVALFGFSLLLYFPQSVHVLDSLMSSQQRVLDSPTSLQQRKNTSLVIVMGNLRGGEQSWKTLYKNVLDVNEADLLLMIGELNKPTDNPAHSSMSERANSPTSFQQRKNNPTPSSTSERANRPASVQQRKNTSLVIVMGNLRGGEKAWKTLFENVLDVNEADLLLMIGEPDNTTNNPTHSSMQERAKYVWTFPEYKDWSDAVDLINGPSWRQTHLPYMRKDNLCGGIANYKGSGIIIFMIRWFLSQKLQDNPNVLQQYERFVLTRSDHYYLCPHYFTQLDVKDRTMYIPSGEGYGGYTDRHLVVSRDDILAALDVLPPFLSKPFDEFQLSPKGGPEAFLKKVWTRKGLKVKTLERTMFSSAIAQDSSRWGKRKAKVPNVLGLFMKYPKEYERARAVCASKVTFTKPR